MTRIGEIERLILQNLLTIENTGNRPPLCDLRYSRNPIYPKVWGYPAIWIRNNIWGLEGITPSIRASFSRALHSLDKKGLIVCRNDICLNNYALKLMLTDDGKQTIATNFQVNNSSKAKMLTPTEAPP